MFQLPCLSVLLCVQKLTSIPADVLQNVTNESCLVCYDCYESEKYAFRDTLRPLGVFGALRAAPWVQSQIL